MKNFCGVNYAVVLDDSFSSVLTSHPHLAMWATHITSAFADSRIDVFDIARLLCVFSKLETQR